MAQKLYKWTGDITSPESWDSALPAPEWYGVDDNGVSYALLDTAFAADCTATDLAVTTATTAKDWVKKNSPQANTIDNDCLEKIRESYTINDELKAHRTNDTEVLNAIGAIVTTHQALKNALVGD
jgi:hypothetical protein